MDFMVDLGLPVRNDDDGNGDDDGDNDDISTPLTVMKPLPHHVVMHYPLEAPKFLSTLRWWRVPDTDEEMAVIPTFHVYTFAKVNDDDDRTVEEVAMDIVAKELLPFPPQLSHGQRRMALDRLEWNVRTRDIRNVAPGKHVVCVTFQTTRRLIRFMQGDFSSQEGGRKNE
mmetsp:Transcript_28567/g.66387  ORF Transcript_28567/g.66387 Transcript_28567/m.66387 type:complete len:170 (-) Transcript_28567:21-530(-)